MSRRHVIRSFIDRSSNPRKIWIALFVLLTTLIWQGRAHSATATLAWTPSSSTDLTGYKLYCGTLSRTYDQIFTIGKQTSFSVNTLQAGKTYYFALTSYNSRGLESGFSEEITWTAQIVNTPPVAKGVSLTVLEDSVGQGMLAASDPEGKPITYSIVTNGAKGTAAITDRATGAFIYTPKADMNGTDSFTFKADDGALTSNIATVAVTITAVNDPPAALDGSRVTGVNTPLTGALAATDLDGDPLTYAIVTKPDLGTLALTDPATGGYLYKPNTGVIGIDSFTYSVSDGKSMSKIATVTIEIAKLPGTDLPLEVGEVMAGSDWQRVELKQIGRASCRERV